MYRVQHAMSAEAELEQLLRHADRAIYAAESEAETAYSPHPDITGVCIRATSVANNLRARIQRVRTSNPSTITSIQKRGAKWLSDVSNAYINRLDRYHPRDLDRLAGCLTRVEAVVRITPPNLRRLRATIANRLGMLRVV